MRAGEERRRPPDSLPLFSQGWLPPLLCRIPTPPGWSHGMGAGEVELAGRGQDGWNRRRARLLESEESTAKPSRFTPTPPWGPRDVGPGGVGKFGKVETAEQTEKNRKVYSLFFLEPRVLKSS